MNTTLSIRYRLLFLVCHPGWSDHRSISYPPPMERDAPVGRPLSLPPPACVPLRYQLPTLTTCIFKSDGTLVRLSLPRGKKRREERTQTRGDGPDADTRGWLPAMCIPPPRRARRRCVFTCRRHNDHTLGLKCIFVMCGAWRGPGGGGKGCRCRVPATSNSSSDDMGTSTATLTLGMTLGLLTALATATSLSGPALGLVPGRRPIRSKPRSPLALPGVTLAPATSHTPIINPRHETRDSEPSTRNHDP